jgi:hypothetical protein
MRVELTDAERVFLLEMMQDRLGTLREQIHHATISTFNEQLRATETLLRGLIDKVDAAGCAVETPASL